MLSPRLDHVNCPHPQGHHRMAFWSWGDADAPHLVVCVHGLTRQGRDFDWLARALVERSSGQIQVVCPDVAGRGASDWLPQSALYQLPQYVSDMLTLLSVLAQRAPIRTLDWVGTSMGGLIGMVLAGQPDLPLPVAMNRLVLNDVGPAIAWASIERMQTFVGRYGRYEDLPQAAAALRALAQGFGPVPEDIWLALSACMVRPHPSGGLTFHYDPAIGEPIRALTKEAAGAAEQLLWGIYDQIRAQVLLIRGLDSDLLMPETALAMTQRGPHAQLLQWPGVGHAPTLTAPDQIEAVTGFLLGALA